MTTTRHRAARILIVVVLCVSCAADTVPGAVHDEVDPRAAERLGSRMLRRRSTTGRRQLEGYGDEDLDLSFGSDEGLGLCKSIIAVGGMRELGATSDRTDGNFYTDGENDLAFDDNDEDGGSDDDDIEFVCELEDESTVPLLGTKEQLQELTRMLHNGDVVSAETAVKVEQGTGLEDTFMQAPGGGGSSLQAVTIPPGPIEIIPNDRRRLQRGNLYSGKKRVLVVRVTDSRGRAIDKDARYISDKFFGTYGDEVTLASGFGDCSFGRMTISNDYGGYVDESLLSAPGVVDVTIPIRLDRSDQGTILAHARMAVGEKLGLNLPYIFDHVTFVVEACYEVGTSCQFVAYAYSNHWLSVFTEDNFKYPAVVMHEYGHNLNLAHSGGLDGDSYSDHTCLMGDPLWNDDLGAMCFNPVKAYQIAMNGATGNGGRGWYDSKHVKVFNSGKQGGTAWRGRLIGSAEYDKNDADHAVVLKIESGGPNDWFLGFNRAVGPNEDSRQAKDRVTIYKVLGGNGLTFSKSSFKGALAEGRTATLKNWRKSGKDMVIWVSEINTEVSPAYADVEITFGDQPTIAPTLSPTISPSAQPSFQPSTSFAPTATPSGFPSTVPTAIPSESPSAEPTSEPSAFPSLEPSYSPSLSGMPTGTPSMYPSVSDMPTASPSAAPSTSSPTDSPTLVPSASPSAAPTREPTKSPSLAPTEAPTTASPSAGPSTSISPTLPACPPPYDPEKTDYVEGEFVEISSYSFQCSMDNAYYCNIPEWDEDLLLEDDNAKAYWDAAWIPVGECSNVIAYVLPSEPTDPPSKALESGIRVFDSGKHDGSWSGELISISHYHDNPTNRAIIVMLASDDGSSWFVGFNGAQVTITKMNEGQNSLKGALVAGQSETIQNWRNSGELVVTVRSIDTSVSPSYANVEITFNGNVYFVDN